MTGVARFAGGATFASTVAVVGGATFTSTTDHAGVARFAAGVTTSALDVTGAARVYGNMAVDNTTLFVNSTSDRVGIGTASPGASLDVNGIVRIVSAGTIGNNGSNLGYPLQISNNPGTISAFFGDGTSTVAYNGNSYSAALRFNGANTWWGDIAYYPHGRTSGFVSGGGEFRFARSGNLVEPTANAMVSVGELLSEGQIWAGATGTFNGNALLLAQNSLLFADANSSHWVGFKSPATVANNVVWTLPATDGTNGQVLSTNSSGTLSWKAADGVTGADKQIQFNLGGTLGATAGLVLEYNTAGYSAGTLGVSGGAYIMGNVGIGITTPAIGARIFDVTTSSTAKLEVRGDIRIPSGGFFVNKNITIPAGVCAGIGADENAFLSGVLTVASGATLSISTGGTLVIL